MRLKVGSALDRLRPLFQVRLGAIPLLTGAQGAILRQMHAAVSAAHHQGCTGLVGALLFGGRAFEFTPEPYRGGNDGNPEQ